jgi:N-acetyl-gamma-glutamyl-phosphate reductase
MNISVRTFNFTNLPSGRNLAASTQEPPMTPRVFIDGNQGTTGLQLVARLAGRNDIELVTLPDEKRKDPLSRAAALDDCDVAVLCLPDEAARQAVAGIRNPRVRVIDASSAHRVDPGWTYGLPELSAMQAGQIAQARCVSNPGCYPTGAIALLRPLVEAGVLRGDAPLTIHAVSGYSGRGREGIEAHEGPAGERPPAFQTYALALRHKHVPEIRLHAGLARRPIFVPSYGSFRQGIALTIGLHADMLQGASTPQALRALLAERYREHPEVHVLDAEATDSLTTLDPQALNGTDALQLAVFGDDAQGQLLLSAVFDNLGKGAAGAAVQNLGMMLGLESVRARTEPNIQRCAA